MWIFDCSESTYEKVINFIKIDLNYCNNRSFARKILKGKSLKTNLEICWLT